MSDLCRSFSMRPFEHRLARLSTTIRSRDIWGPKCPPPNGARWSPEPNGARVNTEFRKCKLHPLKDDVNVFASVFATM